MDILQCIGLSLLIAFPLLFALASRPRALRWTALLLAVAAFGAAPFAESLGPPWEGILNQRADAVFPLLPWGGYVYLGAAVGSATAEKGPRGAAVWVGGPGGPRTRGWALSPWVCAASPPPRFLGVDPPQAARARAPGLPGPPPPL